MDEIKALLKDIGVLEIQGEILRGQLRAAIAKAGLTPAKSDDPDDFCDPPLIRVMLNPTTMATVYLHDNDETNLSVSFTKSIYP